MEGLILGLIVSGSVTSIVSALWGWIKSKREQPNRVDIRLPDGRELSIRTDEATPEEIEGFVTNIVEAEAEREKAERRAEPDALA